MRKKTKIAFLALLGLMLFGCGKKTAKPETKKPTPDVVTTTKKPTTQAKAKYTVVVNSDNAKACTITGVGQVTEGTNVVLTITPKQGYTFLGLYDGEEKVSEALTYTIPNINKNVTLTAKWSVQSFTFSASTVNLVDPSVEAGTVTYETKTSYETDSVIHLKAEPLTGYQFNGWYLVGASTTEPISTEAEFDFNMLGQNTELRAEFGIKQCTIEVEANIPAAMKDYFFQVGSTETENQSVTVDYNTEVQIGADANDGYQYVCLYALDENGDYDPAQPLDVDYYFNATDSAKFLAYFEALDYELDAYSSNGSYGDVQYEYGDDDNFGDSISVDVTYNTSITLTALPKTGYVFTGWYSDSSYADDKLVWDNPTYTFTYTTADDMTLFAEFAPDKTQINYVVLPDGEGVTHGSIDNESGLYDYNSEINLDAIPDTGYHFVGWYFDEDCSDQYDNAASTTYVIKKTGTVTFYAKFEIDSYNVTASFNLLTGVTDENAALMALNSKTYEYGATVTLTAPTMTGYTFVGWYYGAYPEDIAASLAADDIINVLDEDDLISNATFTMGTADVTVTAVYTRHATTVYYNGGTTVDEGKYIYYGANFQLEVPTSNGETFVRWYIRNGLNRISFTDSAARSLAILDKMDEEIQLYAEFTTTIVYYTFDSNGGSDVPEIGVEYGETAEAPEAPKKTGYRFVCWYYNGHEWNFDTPITFNHTLVAQWEIDQFEFELVSADSGKLIVSSDPGNGKYDYQTEIELTVDSIQAGYRFIGWFVNDATAPISTDDNYTYTLAGENIVITAKYEAQVYNITYEFGPRLSAWTWLAPYEGFSLQIEGTMAYGTNVKLKTTVPAGYRFWSYLGNTGAKVDVNSRNSSNPFTFVMPAHDVHVVVEVGSNNYSVTVNTHGILSSGDGDMPYFMLGQTTSTSVYTSTNVACGRTVNAYAFEIDGYTFLGWYNGTGSSATRLTEELEYTFVQDTQPDTLYAKYQVNQYQLNVYKVITDPEGITQTTLDTKTLSYHYAYSNSVEAMTGYTFLGWFMNGSTTPFETDFEFDLDMPCEATNIYAKYEINYYNLDIEAVSGNLDDDNNRIWTLDPGTFTVSATFADNEHKKAFYGRQVTLTVTETTDGYTFDGWYIGGTKACDTTTYQFEMPATGMSIECRWTPETCKINYNGNGGAVPGGTSYKNVKYGQEFELAVPTMTGMSFRGWKYTYDDENDFTHTISLTDKLGKSIGYYEYPSRNAQNKIEITAVAEWGEKLIDIVFDTGYDAATYATNDTKTYTESILYNTAISRPENPVRKGYTFVDWFATDDLENDTLFDFVVTRTADVSTAYARWTRNSYDVSMSTSKYAYSGKSSGVYCSYTYSYFDGTETVSGTITNSTGVVLHDVPYGSEISISPSYFLGCQLLQWDWQSRVDSAKGIVRTTVGDFVWTTNYDFSVNLQLWTTATDEMAPFIFESDMSSVTITGLSDYGKTLTTLTVPNIVTYIQNDAFAGNEVMQVLNIPFVGNSRHTEITDNDVLANLFGTTAGDNYAERTPKYYNYSSHNLVTCDVRYIPKTLKTVNVSDETIINTGAFYNMYLTKITLNSGITRIGSYAFYGNGASNLVLPNTLERLDDYALYYCAFNNTISTFVIPESVSYMGKGALGNTYIHTLRLPFVGKTYNATGNEAVMTWLYIDGIYGTQINQNGQKAYINNTLDTIILTPADGETLVINSYAFANMKYLKYITIPETNSKVIADNTFYGCLALTTLTGDYFAKATTIGQYAFYNCDAITSFTGIVNNIGYAAFYGSDGLVSFTTNTTETTVTIGSEAFVDSSVFANFVMPNTNGKKLVINSYAFSYCSAITEFNYDNVGISIGSYAFESCTNLVTFACKELIDRIGDDAFLGCSSMTTCSIPAWASSVAAEDKVIGEEAFADCSQMESFVIPSDTTTISWGVFWGCSSLKELTIPFVGVNSNATSESNSTVPSEEYIFGRMFGTNSFTDSYQANMKKNASTYEVYYLPKALTKVTLTNIGECIPAYAFYGCGYISIVNITGSKNSYYDIGQCAFGCTHIGEDRATYVEYDYSETPYLTFANGLRKIYPSAFDDLWIHDLVLPDTVIAIYGSAFSNNTFNNYNLVLPNNSDLVIDEYAFYCDDFAKVTIKQFKEIKASAFESACIDEFAFAYYTNAASFGTVNSGVFNYATLTTISFLGTVAQFEEIVAAEKLKIGWNVLEEAYGSTPATVVEKVTCADGQYTI